MMMMSVRVHSSLKYLIIVTCSGELSSVILYDDWSIVMMMAAVGCTRNIVTTSISSHLAVMMTLILNIIIVRLLKFIN